MDFMGKAQWIKDDHKTSHQAKSNYVDIVFRERVQIIFTYAALNGLNIMAMNIQNVYIQAL